MAIWSDDVLGPGFERLDLDLGEDDEGPLVATLVRSLPEPRPLWQRLARRTRPLERVDVLYVHGWSDYFFQRDLARSFTERGARFFALDLRKYGRSLREGQTAGYIENLDDYDLEIGLALEEIGALPRGADAAAPGTPARRDPAPDDSAAGGLATGDSTGSAREGGAAARGRPDPGRPAPVDLDRHPSGRRLLLLGHSTGGLVLSLWAARHPGVASAVVLNSPWLEFQLSGRVRQLVAPLIDLRARFNPHDAAPQLDFGFYSRAQREAAPDHPLEVNALWRPERAHAVSAGWMRSILNGHARIAEGIDVAAPVCVLLSSRSAAPVRWSDELTRADTVLDVDQVARAALKLGHSVTVERVDGALHDVFLSAPGPRAEAYRRLERWVGGWLASA